MERAVELALKSEREGNLPVGAVLVLGGTVIDDLPAAEVETSFRKRGGHLGEYLAELCPSHPMREQPLLEITG